jgi:protein O-GlcNAc transferase
MVYKAKGALSQAKKNYLNALRIDDQLPDVHNNLGTLYMEMGRIDEAVGCFNKALAIRPDYVEAIHNLGNAIQALGKHVEAIDLYEKAIQISPTFSSAYYHCGIAYQNLKKPQTAITYYEKALSIKPNWARAICALYHQCQHICDWQRLEALALLIDSMTSNALERGETPDELPFLSIVRKQNPSENHAIAKAWSTHLSKRNASSAEGNRHYFHPAAGEPITVGYLSNRFRNAPTAYLMMGLFNAHDRKRFRIHCYSYGPDDGGAYRRRIAETCDQFVDISNMDYTQTAERIHSDKVNVLVDLKGYTRNNRLGIFALRPAPIQVAYLGFPGTTGSDFIDYIVADQIIIPERQACHYSENIVFMPHCYMASDDERKISSKKWTRADFGLPDHAVVLCSFNMPYKIDLCLFEAWMEILQTIPQSVLWLLQGEPAYEKNLKEAAVVRGIDASRIIFSPKLPNEEHLSRHRLADLALDTWTCNGHTTTSDALWAGLPVLTLKGKHFVSRVSASLLTAVGMEMLIAEDRTQYRDIAIKLAKNPDQLDRLKKKLRRNISLEPLFNTKQFSNNLEYAYLSMWSNYMAGNAPKSIHVPDQGG